MIKIGITLLLLSFLISIITMFCSNYCSKEKKEYNKIAWLIGYNDTEFFCIAHWIGFTGFWLFSMGVSR